MDSCKTPNNIDPIEFQFNHGSTPLVPDDYIKKMHNLVVGSSGKRCFTPTASDIYSPGLSPIETIELQERKEDQFTFPMPIASCKQFQKISPTTRAQQSPTQQQQQMQQQQQKMQQQQLQIETQFFNENLALVIDLSTSMKFENSSDNSSRFMETSKNSSNILNHTLNVTLLLEELGLGQHREIFAKGGIDLDKFLNIKLSELKSLGLQSDEDCKAIIDMVGKLNSNETKD